MTGVDELIVSVFAAAVRMSAPIVLAALGELYAERSGVINLGCEGMMLIGSFAGYAFTLSSGSNLTGIVFGGLAGGLFGLLMAFLCITLRTDQVVNGVAITILGIGLSAFLFREAFGEGVRASATKLATIPIPLLSQIPIIGPIFFTHHVMVYAAFVSAVLLGIVLFRTTWGLRIRAVGENPAAADSLGVSVILARYACLIFAGTMAGIGGATLVLGELGVFSYGVTSGRGWIAVVLVIFSTWNPYKLLGAALLFSGTDALQLRFQGLGVGIPPQFLLMLPYVTALILLIVLARKAPAPAALGRPYVRE
jgi:simple sugar transport system permease protein